MVGTTALIIGGAVIGGATSLFGASKQASAAKAAAAMQRRQYKQAREDMAPWREAGGSALGELTGLYGFGGAEAQQAAMARFQAAPGYQYQLAQGVQALDRSAAARGNLLSGQQLKAVNAFGQNIAAQGYGDYTNRLAALANVGQSATQQTAALGATAAQNAGTALQNASSAWATGFQGAGNAINTGLNTYLKYT